MNLRETVAITGLALLAVATRWWIWSPEGDGDVVVSTSHGPDFYMHDAVVVTFDGDGRPEGHLTTEALVHYTDDERTELDAPVFLMQRPDAPPWRIVSEQAQVTADGKHIAFLGAVTASRPPTGDQREMKLVTRDLVVRTDEDFAYTDARAELSNGESWLRGIGMKAWLAEPARLRLLAEVRSVHEPR